MLNMGVLRANPGCDASGTVLIILDLTSHFTQQSAVDSELLVWKFLTI